MIKLTKITIITTDEKPCKMITFLDRSTLALSGAGLLWSWETLSRRFFPTGTFSTRGVIPSDYNNYILLALTILDQSEIQFQGTKLLYLWAKLILFTLTNKKSQKNGWGCRFYKKTCVFQSTCSLSGRLLRRALTVRSFKILSPPVRRGGLKSFKTGPIMER